MIKIGSIFTILFLVITGISYADDISISSKVDRDEIAIDGNLTLTITLTGNISNIPQPTIPELKGFTAYSSGRSQNISIINGQVSSSVTFTYILVPDDVGEYTLGPFSINYQGKTYQTDAINIKVTPKSQTQPRQPSYTSPDTQRQPNKQGKELFIETYVDKLRAYVNEQITLTFAFYQAVDLFENPRYSPPSTTGFWTEDMPPQKKYYKVIDGTRYLVTEIKTALFGTSPGEFTIGSARLEASVEDLERFYSRSPFDIFDRDPFSMFRRGKPVILTTDPIRVEILPLPEEGKPDTFLGDVGKFDISATLDKDTVTESQPVTLKIKIQGKGNIKTISTPSIGDYPDLKFYDSASSENISKENYVVQGEKVFEKVIIPKRGGRFSLGPIRYSYFDPLLKKYVEKEIPPFTIVSTESQEEDSRAPSFIVPDFTKEEIKLLKKDIAYIKTFPGKLKSKDAFLYKNKLFLLILILPLFLLGFLYMVEGHRERLRKDVGYARSLRAKAQASRRLREAKKILGLGKVKEFYGEIYKAVIEYIADRLNIPHTSITKDELERKLKDKGIEDATVKDVKGLFEVCDMARFASGNFSKEDMHTTILRAEDIITALVRKI